MQSEHRRFAFNLRFLDTVSPTRPFDASAGGFGAFELVARFGRLEFDEDAFPTYAAAARSAQAATAVGGGFDARGASASATSVRPRPCAR